MGTQFLYAVATGAAIGAALCAMTDSPLDAWARTSKLYGWGLVCFSVAGLLLFVAGATVLSGAILGLGFLLAINGMRLNRKNYDQ